MKILGQLSAKLRGAMPLWIGQWLRDARLLSSSQFVAVLTSTAIAILLARSLGPSEWGLFSALLGVSFALSIFVDLGLGTWLLRELSRLQQEEHSLERRLIESSRRMIGGVLANVAFGSVLLLGAGIAAALLRMEIATAITLLGLVAFTVFTSASNCLEAFLRAERRLKRVVAALFVERFLLLALIGIATLVDAGIWVIGLAYLFAGLARVSFIGFTVFGDRRVPVVLPAFQHIRRFIRSGVPFAFNTVALNMVPRLDTIVIATVSTTAAGYFAVGDGLAWAMVLLPTVASTALYPFLAREAPGSKAAWSISASMMGVGLAAALAGVVLAPVLVPPVFGRSYEDAVPIVQIMLFVVPFVMSSGPLLAHLYTIGKERQLLAMTLAASVSGTVAILVGQVSVGATGAASGYVIRQALFTVALSTMALLHQRAVTGCESS